MRLCLPLLTLVLTAAAPPADSIVTAVVAGARAAPPAGITFDRSVKTTSQEGDAPVESGVRTDRWDGRQLTLVAIDGKPPTASELEDYRKAAAGRPIPGYYRLADFLKGGAIRVPDAQGRTIYRINGLPKGSVTVGKDISSNLLADATVDTSGAQPYVSHLRIYLPKPLSFFMVAKLDTFEAVYDYRPGPAGRPVLVHSVQSLSGAQFGKAGTTRIEASYTIGR